MIDFNKLGAGNTADTVLPPREIFNALPNKQAHKYQYPRDVQSQVWSKWFLERDKPNLVIKMNTGSGKTVVGLTILKSCINEGRFPAAYICPDKYLVKQATDSASELGIETTDDPRSSRFLSGKAILITNIYRLVNGKSVFGVGDDGIKIRLSSLVIDDAHACLETVEDQFSLTAINNTEIYSKIYEIIKDSLHEQCKSKALEIEYGDYTSYIQVPYWTWQEKVNQIREILISHRNDDDILFSWPLIKEKLELCHCVVSAQKIEITPHNVPIHTIPSIAHADRKVFMTATLADDSILASHFGLTSDQLLTPIVPDSAGDIGDRMILLPQVINPNLTDNEIKHFCKSISQEYNVVIITPSTYRAQYWQDVADSTLNSDNLYEGVENLKKCHVGLTILVNKYDGIDLPGDACRLLVIDGFPDVRRQIDKVKQSLLMNSRRQTSQTVQRIEQGMGRGIRSNDDFCAVMLTGKDLTYQLYGNGAIDQFSPGTKAQLRISDEVSEQIQGADLDTIKQTLNHCLLRNIGWITASKGVLATLTYEKITQPDTTTIALREAYNAAYSRRFTEVVDIISAPLNASNDKLEKGYLKQRMAEYINFYDKAEAQKLQLSASADNISTLKPIAGITYQKLSGPASDQASACSAYLSSFGGDTNKLALSINAVLEDLTFKPNSHERFEEAFKNLARYLGIKPQRPEKISRKGPDVLWQLPDNSYWVIECKNESSAQLISKNYCNQLNGHCSWFVDKYGDETDFLPILIHSSQTFEYTSSPYQGTRTINSIKLDNLKEAVRAFITSIIHGNETNDISAIHQKLIAHQLRASELNEKFTSDYKLKNS